MGYSIIRANDCGVENNITTVKDYADVIENYTNMDKADYQKQCDNAKNAAHNYEYTKLTCDIEEILKKA